MKTFSYDPENVLAKILRGDLPAEKVFESEYSLAIEDIRPQAPNHILVLPKGPYVCFDHFSSVAKPNEVSDFFKSASSVIDMLNLSPAHGGGGYRLIANTGADGFQEIAHFHMHILAGRWLGPLLPSEVDVVSAEKEFGQKLSNDVLLNGPSKSE